MSIQATVALSNKITWSLAEIESEISLEDVYANYFVYCLPCLLRMLSTMLQYRIIHCSVLSIFILYHLVLASTKSLVEPSQSDTVSDLVGLYLLNSITAALL